MVRNWLLAGVAAGVALSGVARAQDQVMAVPGGVVVTPASSVVRAADAGLRAHTNVHVFYPGGIRAARRKPYGDYETPGSLACIYGFVPKTPSCNPATATAVPTGGSKVVVIVDAYDDPAARHDLSVFSSYFGLPAVTKDNFEVVFAAGTRPTQDSTGGWELEESLDIEMAHSFAPGAKIILVEAASNSLADLFTAENKATELAEKAGGGEVSNSWGATEFSGEEDDEMYFNGKNVVYFASTGDDWITEFPSVLPNVVAVGGTSIARTAKGAFINQSAWTYSGAGPNRFQIPVPSYQSSVPQVSAIVGAYRAVPDVSFVASTDTGEGVWIYDSVYFNGYPVGWAVVLGTSVSAPAMAATVNRAGNFATSSADELSMIYGDYTNKSYWTDIDIGICGYYQAYSTLKGYDLCTGVGVPNGYDGK